MKKNVLIISASFGTGHDQAAKAIQEALSAHPWIKDASVVDFFGAKSSRFSAVVKKTYLQLLQHYPDFYDFLYHFTQLQRWGLIAQTISARYLKRHMQMLLAVHQPDLLVFTHPFPCGTAAYLRRTGVIKIPLVAQLTDFSVHRLWVYNELDEYCLATEQMKNELLSQGVSPSRLTVTGIPIAAKFGNNVNQSIFKAELGLNPDYPILLIMGGGLGLGAIAEMVRELDKLSLPVSLVIPAGHNQRLQSRHPTIVLPYINRIPELMSAADILITKPGGLTCAEAMTMELPMVFFRPLPGQEEGNALYLVGQGAARWVHNRQSLADVLYSMLTTPSYLADIKLQLRLMKRPAAAAAVCAVIKRHLFNEPLGCSTDAICRTSVPSG